MCWAKPPPLGLNSVCGALTLAVIRPKGPAYLRTLQPESHPVSFGPFPEAPSEKMRFVELRHRRKTGAQFAQNLRNIRSFGPSWESKPRRAAWEIGRRLKTNNNRV